MQIDINSTEWIFLFKPRTANICVNTQLANIFANTPNGKRPEGPTSSKPRASDHRKRHPG